MCGEHALDMYKCVCMHVCDRVYHKYMLLRLLIEYQPMPWPARATPKKTTAKRRVTTPQKPVADTHTYTCTYAITTTCNTNVNTFIGYAKIGWKAIKVEKAAKSNNYLLTYYLTCQCSVAGSVRFAAAFLHATWFCAQGKKENNNNNNYWHMRAHSAAKAGMTSAVALTTTTIVDTPTATRSTALQLLFDLRIEISFSQL